MKKIKFKIILFSIFHVFFAFHAISNIKKIKIGVKKKIPGGGGGGVELLFFLISRFMLFSTLQKIETPRPSVRPSRLVYWLNGRWFLQIPVVDRDSWNIYPLYTLILYLKCGGGFGRGGGGGV